MKQNTTKSRIVKSVLLLVLVFALAMAFKMGIRKSHEIPQQETVYVVEKIVEYNIQSYKNDFVILYKTGDSNNVYRINVNDDFYDDVCVGDSITITIIK